MQVAAAVMFFWKVGKKSGCRLKPRIERRFYLGTYNCFIEKMKVEDSQPFRAL
jgi:hypothetical protein